jgi:hypothetical protein
MTLIALGLSVFVAGFGALGVLLPTGFLSLLRRFESSTGLYVAAAFRIALGISLIYSAHTSHTPEVIRIVGIVILLAGLALPFIGVDRVRTVIEWLSSRGPLAVRIWAGVTLAFGLFLIYAVVT